MALIIKTSNPGSLLSKIKKAIDSDEVMTWSYDSDGDFTHTPDQWKNKAWLTVKKNGLEELSFGILGQKDVNTSKLIYAVYHGRFAEMLLNHFDIEISEIKITSMPTSFDQITTNKIIMNDTLQIVLDSINSQSLNEIDIVQKVDAFYNNAWNKLILIITVVGVIVPLFIQWLQKKSLKASEELLKNEINSQTIKIKEKITTELTRLIDSKFKEYEKEIKITRASGKAKASYSEGKYNLEKNNYDRALGEFINSAYACIESDDHRTLQDVVKSILDDCLPFLSKEEIEDLKIAKNGDLSLFIEYLSEKDDRGVFQAIIGEILVKMTKLPKTIKDKPSEKSKKAEEK